MCNMQNICKTLVKNYAKNMQTIPGSFHKCLLNRWPNVETAVDLESEVDPRIRTRTASGDPVWSDNAISGQRSPSSFLLPPSSPTPKDPQARSLD